MYSSTKEADIQFQLYFLDCQPESINRSLNDPSVWDHLDRAGTNQLWRFDKSYQRKESHRVTDIDQLSLSISPDLLTPQRLITLTTPIEIRTSPVELPAETDVRIPQAPPLPPSLDFAVKTITPPLDPQSLWANVENQNVAEYFNQSTNRISPKTPNKPLEAKCRNILDDRKTYNLGMSIFPI